jgi:hypothetical protein
MRPDVLDTFSRTMSWRKEGWCSGDSYGGYGSRASSRFKPFAFWKMRQRPESSF